MGETLGIAFASQRWKNLPSMRIWLRNVADRCFVEMQLWRYDNAFKSMHQTLLHGEQCREEGNEWNTVPSHGAGCWLLAA